MTTNGRKPLVQGIGLVLLAALAGGIGALVWGSQQTPRWEAVGSVFIQPNGRLESGADVVSGLYPLDQSRLIPTYGDIAASESVHAEAARRAGLGDAHGYRVRARTLPDSFALEVAVTGPQADVAEAFATEVIATASQRFTEAFRVYSVTGLSTPRATRSDLGLLPATALGVVAGATAGLLLALLLAPLRGGSEVARLEDGAADAQSDKGRVGARGRRPAARPARVEAPAPHAAEGAREPEADTSGVTGNAARHGLPEALRGMP